MEQQAIRIGVTATLVGPYAVMGEDGVRGVQLALDEFNGHILGRPIQLFVESTSGIPDAAVSAIEKLLDQQGVDFTVAPLSGNEGWAIRDFAKTRPNKTFLNGIAGAQIMTLRDPAPNFFNFATNGTQWMAGLGTYVYEELGYKRIATIGEDYSFPHSQIGGFMLEFCRLGGRVVQKNWVALGTSNYLDPLNALPDNIDALFVVLAGTDAVGFAKQYAQIPHPLPLVVGTTTTDQTVLGVGDMPLTGLVGAVSARPLADDNPDPGWQDFMQAYQRRYPDALPFPSLFALGYYINTKAALLALQEIGGDLSTGHTAFQNALAQLEFETPSGPVRLNHNRQATANNFVTVAQQTSDGKLFNHLLQTVHEVDQTLGMDEATYLEIGAFTRDHPACP